MANYKIIRVGEMPDKPNGTRGYHISLTIEHLNNPATHAQGNTVTNGAFLVSDPQGEPYVDFTKTRFAELGKLIIKKAREVL